MVKQRIVFDILVNEKDAAADQALLAALRDTDLGTAQVIIETLIKRNNSIGLYGLVASFHELIEPLRMQILSELNCLFSVLREASQSRNDQTRLNVLEIILRGRAYRASYLVDTALHDRSARIRKSAAETIYSLADELLKSPMIHDLKNKVDSLTPENMQTAMADLNCYMEDRRQVVGAIESGLSTFSLHMHPQVVEAAMWFIDDLGSRFWQTTAGSGSRTFRAALTILKQTIQPRMVPFMIRALHYGEFRPHVIKKLATCEDPIFWNEWLRQSWRLVRPKAARGMAWLKELECLNNLPTLLTELGHESQRHLSRWIGASGLSDGSKIDLLKQLYFNSNDTTRRSAVWTLTQCTTRQATQLLQAIADENDSKPSRMALFELARRHPMDYPPSTLSLSTKSNTRFDLPSLRSSSFITFDHYWEIFDRLSTTDQEKFGAELLKDMNTVRTNLNQYLIDEKCSCRIRAIRMITALRLSDEFADQLYHLSYDPHSEVRSAVMKALSEIPNSTAKRILHNALNDQDMRVQANAVEAIDLIGDTSRVKQLIPKLNSPNNRVRANAAKALLKLGVREAAETLIQMLKDDNRSMRISALWLMDNMDLSALVKRIVYIAEKDTDAQVRSRAKNLMDRIMSKKEENPEPVREESENTTVCG